VNASELDTESKYLILREHAFRGQTL